MELLYILLKDNINNYYHVPNSFLAEDISSHVSAQLINFDFIPNFIPYFWAKRCKPMM